MRNKLFFLIALAATQLSQPLQASQTPSPVPSDFNKGQQAALLNIIIDAQACYRCKIKARNDYSSSTKNNANILPTDAKIKLQCRPAFNNPKPICPFCSVK